MTDLLHSLLDLGDATSRNLDFAHKSNYLVSFGEETITETNLLELLRRHPDIISVETFSKAKESKNGADWEWTFIGKKYQYSMRVQAKRIQRNGALRINHKVGNKKIQQIDLLLDDARAYNLDAFYCIYCSERDRVIWATPMKGGSLRRVSEYGCLMVDARKVKDKSPKKLSDIEQDCFPWHFLTFDDDLRISYDEETYNGSSRGLIVKLSPPSGFGTGIFFSDTEQRQRPEDLPTIDYLNGFGERKLFRSGLIDANPDEVFRVRTAEETDDYRTRRISKRLIFDVREFEGREI
ncbi:DUF6615 family protein [Gymnodinialimonas ceratoperidinii]|uniref:Uncharacterized protein n=1 Tax=Gymnodinialimonas ceratoperidinii TaxID=2856823 RepID=A0A8F6TZ69_9RHOB|nr:DUF6615 family protein [Gymnodinialimonas ceratoperidinii]QXT41158.1 hypothetical protein KYE46_08105 [Gymnodinialimonas ceratoperidinii]